MIRFLNIRHYAGDKELYAGLNWHVRPGERIGLVGDNGTGKTTLLRMTIGEVNPGDGNVVVTKGVRIGFLKQEIHAATGSDTVLMEAMRAFEVFTAAEAELETIYTALETATVEEQVPLLDRLHVLQEMAESHNLGQSESEARKVLIGLGFRQEEIDRPLSAFSGGWQMRAHIARLLLERPDVLILDEPTNHLDLESIGWLEQFLANFPGALIVVSHDRFFLDTITTKTAWLHQRRIQTFAMNYSGFLTERAEQEEMLIRRHKNQQDEIAHIQDFIDRFRAKASKAAAVQSRVKALEKIERIELPAGARRVRLRLPDPSPCGDPVVLLKDVVKAYGDNLVLDGVTVDVKLGDKVALVGRNGAGKSTLLKIMAGVLDFKGERITNSKIQIEYFSQHRVDELVLDHTLLEAARPPGAVQSEEELRSLLGCFLFSGDDVFKPVRVLSGGEKSRLALARMMLRKGNLLLLDEPTNHLDIVTRETLQEALHAYKGTVVLISHDRYFIDHIATRTFEVNARKVTPYWGNYTDYLAEKNYADDAQEDLRGRAGGGSSGKGAGKKLSPSDGNSSAGPNVASARAATSASSLSALSVVQALASEPVKATKGPSTPGADTATAPPQLSKKERAEQRNKLSAAVKKIEQQIEKMEARLAEIRALQADPESYTTGKLTPAIQAEATRLETDLEKATTEWEAASEEYAAVTRG